MEFSPVHLAGLLIQSRDKGSRIFVTCHYNGSATGNGYHGTILIPGSYAKPELLKDGKNVLYIGSFRALKIIPRAKPATGSSVGLILRPSNCLILAGNLLVGAVKMPLHPEPRAHRGNVLHPRRQREGRSDVDDVGMSLITNR